ncbi:MAG: 4Fe-4S binding protein [Clostridiales Family XIII bacterium]|jgi:indolepyruvate ferredoxin oxidoreductase alpha subunit|nr:4Fe-4S binding protein [Clostridiales Family XIII bacterium]
MDKDIPMNQRSPKRLLMGNEAIALGALRAGVLVCAGYPGTPSTEILETIAREKPDGVYFEWSVNEKAAMEVASGAAISGARSLVTMKQVGLNVASDPLMSLNYVGVKAGMVVVVADDPGPISSQTEQDTRHFGRFAKICVFDPSTSEDAYAMTAAAFELSERIRRPVILRPTTRVCHSYTSVEMLPDLPRNIPSGFTKDGGTWAIFPRLSYANKIETEQALAALSEDMSEAVGNLLIRGRRGQGADAGRRRYGIASGGVSWQYVEEAIARIEEREDEPPEYDLLKIGTYPLPENMCADFMGGVDEVLVIEELDPFIEDELARIAGRRRRGVVIRGKRTGDMPVAGECSSDVAKKAIAGFLGLPDAAPQSGAISVAGGMPPPPPRPPVLCAGCPHRGAFFAVKEAMKGRAATYSGDIGCYTLGNAAPLDMVDTCLCMGAGITQAQGIARAAERQGDDGTTHFAFIGDSTFLHTGVPGLMNAAWNGADMIVCILDNSTTAMTGGQPHPGMGERLDGSKAVKIDIYDMAVAAGASRVYRADPFDVGSCKELVAKAAGEAGVRVIIFEGPCINLVPKGDALSVSGGCTGCSLCVTKLGCPALSMREGRAEVDEALCTGCGLCDDVCPFGALG